ncbi:GNAT family N-acetyltransferase [Clostridium subterminale]|uniref:GNAT family N-acetyltransferase n=1 Tax=Clostridium subterminale TaxID=1550 RepID=A0ABN1KSR8_CLOSU
MIYLEEVTEKNWREVKSLEVEKEQQQYVCSNVGILAKAYAFSSQRSQAKAIYNDSEIVGLLMYRECDEVQAFVFDQMMIDCRFQRKGYGEEAVSKAIKLMRNNGKYNRIVLCYCDGDIIAKNLYTKLGFYHTGEVDEDEIIMALDL